MLMIRRPGLPAAGEIRLRDGVAAGGDRPRVGAEAAGIARPAPRSPGAASRQAPRLSRAPPRARPGTSAGATACRPAPSARPRRSGRPGRCGRERRPVRPAGSGATSSSSSPTRPAASNSPRFQAQVHQAQPRGLAGVGHEIQVEDLVKRVEVVRPGGLEHRGGGAFVARAISVEPLLRPAAPVAACTRSLMFPYWLIVCVSSSRDGTTRSLYFWRTSW